jgi:ATP-dependent DNA helicase PIF1
MRNLNTKEALVNGTRMRIKLMHRIAIDCEVLTGTERNKRILIPRINLTYSGTILPFNFQRSQFPIIAAFAMTINKSQKQTFEKIGILVRQPVFNCTSQQVEFDHSMI